MDFLIEDSVLQSLASAQPIVGEISYEARGVFAINAAEELQGTLWIVKEGQLQVNNLGLASYQVYDKNGNTVAGLNESGISADTNGQYKITPVDAIALKDLTHYVVKITIIFEGQARSNHVGIVIGE